MKGEGINWDLIVVCWPGLVFRGITSFLLKVNYFQINILINLLVFQPKNNNIYYNLHL